MSKDPMTNGGGAETVSGRPEGIGNQPAMFNLLKTRVTSPQTDAAMMLACCLFLAFFALGFLLEDFRSRMGWALFLFSGMQLFNLWLNWRRVADDADPR